MAMNERVTMSATSSALGNLLLLDRMEEYRKILGRMNSIERWLLEIVQRGYHCRLTELQDSDPKQTKMFRLKGGRLLDNNSLIPLDAWIEEISKTDIYSNYIDICRELALLPIQNITFFKELPKLIPIVTQIEKYRQVAGGEKILVVQDIKHKITPRNVLHIYRQNRQMAKEQQQEPRHLNSSTESFSSLSFSSSSISTRPRDGDLTAASLEEDFNRPYIAYICMPTLAKCFEILVDRHPLFSYCCIMNNSTPPGLKTVNNYARNVDSHSLPLESYYKLYPPTFYIINGVNYCNPNFDQRYLSYLNLDLIDSNESAQKQQNVDTSSVQVVNEEEKQQQQIFHLYDTNKFLTRYLLDNQCEVSLVPAEQLREEVLVDDKKVYYAYLKRYGIVTVTILTNNPSVTGGFENRPASNLIATTMTTTMNSGKNLSGSESLETTTNEQGDDDDEQVSTRPFIKTLLRGSNRINKVSSGAASHIKKTTTSKYSTRMSATRAGQSSTIKRMRTRSSYEEEGEEEEVIDKSHEDESVTPSSTLATSIPLLLLPSESEMSIPNTGYLDSTLHDLSLGTSLIDLGGKSGVETITESSVIVHSTSTQQQQQEEEEDNLLNRHQSEVVSFLDPESSNSNFTFLGYFDRNESASVAEESDRFDHSSSTAATTQGENMLNCEVGTATLFNVDPTIEDLDICHLDQKTVISEAKRIEEGHQKRIEEEKREEEKREEEKKGEEKVKRGLEKLETQPVKVVEVMNEGSIKETLIVLDRENIKKTTSKRVVVYRLPGYYKKNFNCVADKNAAVTLEDESIVSTMAITATTSSTTTLMTSSLVMKEEVEKNKKKRKRVQDEEDDKEKKKVDDEVSETRCLPKRQKCKEPVQSESGSKSTAANMSVDPDPSHDQDLIMYILE